MKLLVLTTFIKLFAHINLITYMYILMCSLCTLYTSYDVFEGVGSQFLTVATGCLVLALLGTFNVHKHGQLNTAAIVLYAFTSCE